MRLELSWDDWARKGWLDVGASLGDVCARAEEIGRSGRALPYRTAVVLAGGVMAELGENVAPLERGEWRPSFAMRGSVAAVQDGAGWRLEGELRHVGFAADADGFCVFARAAHDVPALFLIDAADPGVDVEALTSIGADAPADLRLGGARARRLDDDGDRCKAAVERALDRARVAEAAELTGAAGAALDYAVDYVKRREQFGRAIGSFQAVQHRCADMRIDLDAARLAVHDAVERADAGESIELTASLTWLTCAGAAQRVTASAHQICGAESFYADSELPRWYRRARALDVQLGSLDECRDRVATRMRAAGPQLA